MRINKEMTPELASIYKDIENIKPKEKIVYYVGNMAFDTYNNWPLKTFRDKIDHLRSMGIITTAQRKLPKDRKSMFHKYEHIAIGIKRLEK
jgi:hypothetical protein